jgi:DNA-directed RNA polymerase subunit RPC12/RpoP
VSRADLFGPVPVKPRRVMMAAHDAGSFPDGKDAAEFRCRKCGHETGWIYASRSEVRRGIPCTRCNKGQEA